MKNQKADTVVFKATPAMLRGMIVIQDLDAMIERLAERYHLGPHNSEPVDRLPAQFEYEPLSKTRFRMNVVARENRSATQFSGREQVVGEGEIFILLEEVTFWWISRTDENNKGVKEWTLSKKLVALFNKVRSVADRTGDGDLDLHTDEMEQLRVLYESELAQRENDWRAGKIVNRPLPTFMEEAAVPV